MRQKQFFKKSSTRGFTLVELLVVISIIAILASIGMATYSSVSKTARNAKRIADLKEIKSALETYKAAVGSYPSTGAAGSIYWRSECSTFGSYANNAVIPNLVPNYMPTLPRDPSFTDGSANNCYAYWGKAGTDYKLTVWNPADISTTADLLKMPPDLIDPINPNVPNSCNPADVGNNGYKLAIYTPGLRCNNAN